MRLSKCSFCGSSPRVCLKRKEFGLNVYVLSAYVHCPFCMTRGPSFSEFDYPGLPDVRNLASEGWNKVHDGKESTK